MAFHLSHRARGLLAIIIISFLFFAGELVVALKTRSLAVLADAMHQLTDIFVYCVQLAAEHISQRERENPSVTRHNFQNAPILGAFFNSVFLAALGFFMVIQSVERFLTIERIHSPELVLIMGCVGLGLNGLSATIVGMSSSLD